MTILVASSPTANTSRIARRRANSRAKSSSAALLAPTPPPEKIDAIYLSPDAFARRTDEASIADQMGDVFVPPPVSRAPSQPTTTASADGC